MDPSPAGDPRPAVPAASEPAGRNRWIVLILVTLAQFIVALDATVVNVALPSIDRDLGMSEADLQWVVNAYALIFGGFLLLGGRLCDLFGRRRLFVAGLVVFTVASAISGLATDAVVLTVGRGLQGLGGALVSPAVLAIINTTFRDPAERTKALGVWGAVVAGGSAFGLLIGGLLTGALSWHWIFFVNLPIGAVVLLAAVRVIGESRDENADRSLDVAGAVTVTGGLVLAVYTMVNGQAWGWASARTLTLGAVAVLLLAAFVLIESRTRQPMMRLSIFRLRTLAVADAALIFLTSGIATMFFFSALYLQGALGYSPLQGGLAFLPAAMGVMVGATLSEPLVRRLGHILVTVIGLCLGALGMAYLTRLPIDGSYLTDLLPGLLPLSIGLGIAYVPITFLATSGTADADSGLASGIYQTVQQIGGAVGLAILAAMATARTTDLLGDPAAADPAEQLAAQVAGFRVAFAGGVVLLLCGAAITALFLRRRHVAALLETSAAGADAPAPAEPVAKG
ncbi:MFS transporter [Micromonospora sp. AMSO1212t]|uniref:MFS transporter n=1 Tax=Micromonospora sp. AMSO1212t TaxID=2650565 RepID=UPI00124B5F18|nr:MFS transporter [Micromonospora sp. AMSO1212t]KAB1910357.1 MFS transporter [Micromonospora sp. AMSO1212t]